MALSGASTPLIISVRLGSARVEAVNRGLEVVLPTIEADVLAGAIITVEEHAVRGLTDIEAGVSEAPGQAAYCRQAF